MTSFPGSKHLMNPAKFDFGGFKQSGISREGYIKGLHPYLETKSMVFDKLPENS